MYDTELSVFDIEQDIRIGFWFKFVQTYSPLFLIDL